jgi:transcriptional regulator with XRE-family HTH domain
LYTAALNLESKKGRDLKPEAIWDFRKRHNLTGLELAEMLGVHKSQISRWETGQRQIPLWLEKFLACLDGIFADKALAFRKVDSKS